MYDKLKKQSKQQYTNHALKIYSKCNKDIDENIESMITKGMSQNKKSCLLFYEEDVTVTTGINYDRLFTEFHQLPYDKPILSRLREKFTEPNFKCSAEHVNYSTHDFFDPDSPDVNYYVVRIEWDLHEDCKCILF